MPDFRKRLKVREKRCALFGCARDVTTSATCARLNIGVDTESSPFFLANAKQLLPDRSDLILSHFNRILIAKLVKFVVLLYLDQGTPDCRLF